MSAKCKASPTWIWRITTNKVINRPVGDISPCMDKMFFPWAYWSWLKCAAYQFYPALHEICSWPLLTLNAYTKIYKNLFKIGQKTFNITYDQLLTYFFFCVKRVTDSASHKLPNRSSVKATKGRIQIFINICR